MKRLLIFILLLTNSMYAMKAQKGKPLLMPRVCPFVTHTDELKKSILEGVRKTHALNQEQAQRIADNIRLSLKRTGSTGSKLIMLFVYKGDESFKGLLEKPDTNTYAALGRFACALAGKRLASAGHKGLAVDPSLPTTSNHEVEIISYAYGEGQEADVAKLLDLLVFTLEGFNERNKIKFVIAAEGGSTHIVNKMSQMQRRTLLDTLIYFQSPIYELSWTLLGYSYDESMAPKNFLHLYNLYTKGAPQMAAYVGAQTLKYPERKYRQQAHIENGTLITPVKNIRALKVDPSNQLVNFAIEDFFSEYAIDNYLNLFDQADWYQINFDLIAKIFAQEKAKPSVAINRFVRLNGSNLEQIYGTSLFGAEYYYPVIALDGLSLKNSKHQFSLEVEESIGALINIMAIPLSEGWFVIKKLIGDVSSDIARIKRQYDEVLASPLYEFKVPADAQQLSKIVTDPIAPQIKKFAHETDISESFITGQMLIGAYYMREILNGNADAVPHRDQEEFLRSIIAMIWFFYSQALRENRPFEEGTFVIEDTGWKINDFLMRYVRTYGATVAGTVLAKKELNIHQPLTGTLQDPALNFSYNPFAYPRESSHFTDSQKQFRHYGIDIRFGMGGSELPLLPADKRHILFGKIDEQKQLIFIKPENYGIYYKEGGLYHASEFIESQLRKKGLTPKTDDDPSYAKERVPVAFIKDFKQALVDAEIPEARVNEIMALAKSHDGGIKMLYFDDLLAKKPIQDLEAKYARTYNHLRLRTGREIIILNQQLGRP